MNGDALELIRQVWEPLGKPKLFNGDSSFEMNHSAYADYYTKHWLLMTAGHSSGQHPRPTDTNDILSLVQQIHAGKTHEEIRAWVQAKGSGAFVTQIGHEYSINLALRLVSMTKFGFGPGEFVPHRCPPRYHAWEQGSLKEYLKSYFDKPPVLSCDRLRLPKTFHAWSIDKIGGIDISFTDNLADHLLLVEDDSKLMIFHHVSFLEYQNESVPR